jgi:hypothetical protein
MPDRPFGSGSGWVRRRVVVEKTIVELNQEGAITLPEDVRREFPAGTHFLVRRKERNVILLALPQQAPVSFDLSVQAFEFANDLIAEEHEDYLLQTALGNENQEIGEG